MGFCLGSANLENRAAIEAPGPADTAVEQIRSVWRGPCAAAAEAESRSAVVGPYIGPEQPDSLENLASPLVARASKEMPHVNCFDCGLHAKRLFKKNFLLGCGE